MSIIPLKKITICGLFNEKVKILNELQALGCLHLIPLREPLAEPEKALPVRPEDTLKALRFLIDCPNKRHQVKEFKGFDIEDCVKKVLVNKQRIRDISDKRDFHMQRIKEVEPWGDFDLPIDEDLSGLKFWFYIVSIGKMKTLTNTDLLWQIVHQDPRFVYIVVMAQQEPSAEDMPVPRSHTGTLSLSQLYKELNQTELELEDLQAEKESLTRWIYLITKNLAKAEDLAALNHASEWTLDKDGIFVLQGWLPIVNLKRLREFTDKYNLALLEEEPNLADTPPTLLENPKELAGGQDLVCFYQIPGYRDWDPSLIVFFSFALFFAIILSDAGYAILLGLILLFFWQRIGKSSTGRHLRNLAVVLALMSVIWGALVGSYFGMSPPKNSLFASLKGLDVNDFDSMMRLSIIVGVLHLTLANGFLARQFWSKKTAFVPIGWIGVMFGGLLLWFGESGVPKVEYASQVGIGLITLGGAAVF